MSIPSIKVLNNKKVLYVDDKPFFMIAGEIHNSSSSNIDYLDPILEKLESINLNSVLLPITWQQFEPIEGKFNYDYVKDILDCAIKHNLKLGILWFGSWKNAAMSYAPNWVKENYNRFKRVELIKGKTQYIRKNVLMDMSYTTLSPFCEETMHADAKAFTALMEYFKEFDTSHTVITVQVENETGFLGKDFDYSSKSLELYNENVPYSLLKYLEVRKDTIDKKLRVDFSKPDTWENIFKNNAHEVFTAYYISKYVGYITECGKKVYPLPMGVNCWLDSKCSKAGMYPNGGPISSMMEIWMYNAPKIDYYSPDIYLYDFFGICDKFSKYNNPIYIPESKICSKMVARQLKIVGHYNGICYAAFGIEDIFNQPKVDLSRFAWMLGFSVDSHKYYPQDVELYSIINKLLSDALPSILNQYGTNKIECFAKEKGKIVNTKDFDNVRFKTTFIPFGKCKDSATLIWKDNEYFYILGYGSMSNFVSLDNKLPYLEYLSIEEGYFKDNEFKTTRILNGDEEFLLCLKPSILRVKLNLFN